MTTSTDAMKPRSLRLQQKARAFGTGSFCFLMSAIFFGSMGYLAQTADMFVCGLGLYFAAFFSAIGSIALFTDMLDAYRAAEREEYWEHRRYMDQFHHVRRF